MRNNRFASTAGLISLVGFIVWGASDRYRAVTARASELERQNASLLAGYDHLRGFAIECLVREEQSLLSRYDPTPEPTAEYGEPSRHASTTAPRSPLTTR